MTGVSGAAPAGAGLDAQPLFTPGPPGSPFIFLPFVSSLSFSCCLVREILNTVLMGQLSGSGGGPQGLGRLGKRRGPRQIQAQQGRRVEGLGAQGAGPRAGGGGAVPSSVPTVTSRLLPTPRGRL